MVRTVLPMMKNIDIKTFPRLTALLKQKSVKHHSKKSSVFNKLEIRTFLRKANHKAFQALGEKKTLWIFKNKSSKIFLNENLKVYKREQFL